MAVAADRIDYDPREVESGFTKPIVLDAVIYDGAMIALATSEHATSASRGKILPQARTKGFKTMGRGDNTGLPPVYNADGTIPDGRTGNTGGTIESNTITRGHQNRVVVAGATAITDNGQYVYLSDDNVYTLTVPSIETGFSGIPDGEIVAWESSTTCIVLEYSLEFKSLLYLMGGLLRYESFVCPWTLVGDGKLVSNFKMNCHGDIVDAFCLNQVVLTGSGGTMAFNISLETVDIAASVATVSTAATPAVGAKTALTLKTAGETRFHQGDDLDVDISATGGTRTTGFCTIWIRYMTYLGN